MGKVEKLFAQYGMPTSMPPPTGVHLGQIPHTSGPGPFNQIVVSNLPSGGIGSLMDMIMARRRARQRIADQRDMRLPPPRMQEGGAIRDMRFIDGNGTGIADRDEVSTMPIMPPATQESLFGPNASAVMKEAMREYGGMRSPYEGFAEYFSRPVFARSTPQTEPPAPTGSDTSPPVADPPPTPALGAGDPRQDLDARIAQLMNPANQGLTREQALYNQLKSIGKGYDLNNDGVVTNAEFQMSMTPEFTGVDSRIQELMDSGMTRLEALAKQSYGIQQGFDLNNDGMVTNAEYAEFMRNQPAPTAPAPETAPVEDVAADAPPALPDSVQIAIDSLREQGIPGIFGGNFDLAALQKQIAEYLESIGYQAPQPTAQPQPTMPVPGRTIVDRVQTPMVIR